MPDEHAKTNMEALGITSAGTEQDLRILYTYLKEQQQDCGFENPVCVVPRLLWDHVLVDAGRDPIHPVKRCVWGDLMVSYSRAHEDDVTRIVPDDNYRLPDGAPHPRPWSQQASVR